MPLNDTVSGFAFSMLSDVGRVRSGNEDFCAAKAESGIFIVCDGMGGAAAGEVASHLAATTFVDYVDAALQGEQQVAVELLLQAAVEVANREVRQQARQEANLRGMGTTLVALLLEQDDASRDRSLWLVHVGDSRCYRVRDGALEPMTQDHSLVQEQIMAGQMTPEQAERSPIRNIITRAIGSAPKVQAEIRRLHPRPGDLYLLASDGLTRELPDDVIGKLLVEASREDQGKQDLESTCSALIAAANEAGGHDNVTALLLRIEP